MTAIEISEEELQRLAAKKDKKKKEKKERKEKKEKKEKNEKKSKKRKHDEEDEDHDSDSDNDNDNETRRSSKLKKRKELMAQVPERDEYGISYTKLQRRRMMKRVKRGLPPVPTPEEEAERLRNEAQLRREEEAELAGMIYTRENEKKEHDEGKGNDDDGEEVDDIDDDDNGDEDNGDDDNGDDDNGDDDNGDDERPRKEAADHSEAKPSSEQEANGIDRSSSENDVSAPPSKKPKRSKPVPTDYVCQACKNKHTHPHWIYDCPEKVTMRGTNQVSKKSKGLNAPDSRKVFVSGLPFETKRKDVETMFASCGKMVNCKLLTFPDTGRCKGQAYLTFETDDSAKKAIALSGTTIENKSAGDKEKKKDPKRKELKLTVIKMLSRNVTKKQGR